MPATDAVFRCPQCGKTQTVLFCDALSHGWPKCTACDRTMEIDTMQTTVSAALDQAMHPIIERVGEALYTLNHRENRRGE